MNRLRYNKTYYINLLTPFPQSICFSLIYDWLKVKSKESDSDYMQLTFMEKGNELESEDYKNITPLYYFYVQLLHALHIGQIQYGFVHGDLHMGNLMTKKLSSIIILENNDYYEYNIISKGNLDKDSLIVNSFRIPTSQVKIVPLIIDFGRSRIQVPFRNAHLITDEMGNRKYSLKINIQHIYKKEKCTRILYYPLGPEVNDGRMGIIKNEDLYFMLESFSDHSLRDAIRKKLFPFTIYNPSEARASSGQSSDDVGFAHTSWRQSRHDPSEARTSSRLCLDDLPRPSRQAEFALRDHQNNFVSVSDGDFSYDMRLQSGSILSKEKVLFSWIIDTFPIYTKEFAENLFFDQLRIFGEGSIIEGIKGVGFYTSEEYLIKFPTIYADNVLKKVGSALETVHFFKKRIEGLFIRDGILTDYFIDIEDIISTLLKEGLNWENNIYKTTTTSSTIISASDKVNQFIKNIFDDFINSKLDSNHNDGREATTSWRSHDVNYQSIFYMIVYAARMFRKISMLKKEYITELGNLIHLLFSMSCMEEIMPTRNDSMFDKFAKIRRETVKRKKEKEENALWTNNKVFFLQLLADAVRRGRRYEHNAVNPSFVCYLMMLGSIQWNKGLAHINFDIKNI
jgi:hypothetical protein